ncbi:hypothetical protein KUW17_21025 [Leisingera aquaemixtae]|uniref:hypothetical protein n=1 Tax=Leisingera aquaemixtae TaxID=1396826 RepID=UPI001C95E9CC|nr:hypothetical protein [Leisingera aquaemixtae]MBY6069240.1 hypothetical protein [Leisingera aquaemixtae]
MFIPVAGRVDPIKPNRGHLTARPVVRSDDPDQSESADNTPRERDGNPRDSRQPLGAGSLSHASDTAAAADDGELLNENAVLAQHLLLQCACQRNIGTVLAAGTAFHGYEAARTLSA